MPSGAATGVFFQRQGEDCRNDIKKTGEPA
jgi:hypothetical protein